jgi:hypothetical protein
VALEPKGKKQNRQEAARKMRQGEGSRPRAEEDPKQAGAGELAEQDLDRVAGGQFQDIHF